MKRVHLGTEQRSGRGPHRGPHPEGPRCGPQPLPSQLSRQRSELASAHALIPWLIILAILALAAFLRFYALSQRGLIYWDEAKFALEGIRLQAALQALLGGHVALTAGKAIGTAKPTHALLIALAYALLGVHDYTPLFLDAAGSVAEVALIYLIARRLFSPAVGLIAALFLAVSEYDIIYARSALSETDANALLLAGILFWIYSWVHPHPPSPLSHEWERGETARMNAPLPPAGEGLGVRVGIAALFMGISFTTNYRLLVYIAAIVAFDLLWTWRESGWRAAGRRALPWSAGLAAAPVLWQLIDLFARAHGSVLFQSELTGARSSYVQEVLYQIHGGRQAITHFAPLAYVQWYSARQGWAMGVLVLAGLILALVRRSRPWLLMAVPVVVPYLVYVFAPFIVPRNLDAAIPLTCVLAAAAVGEAAVWLRTLPAGRILLVAAVLFLAALDGALSWRLTGERSGFTRAAAYVARHDLGRTLTTSEIIVFYLRGSGLHCKALRVPRTISQLSADIKAGYHYAIIDHSTWRVARLIRTRMALVARYPSFGQVSLGENPIYSENTGLPNPNAGIPLVSVYRLSGASLPPPRGERAGVCDRNIV